MTLNSRSCHYMLIGRNYHNDSIAVKGVELNSSKILQILVQIFMDKNLNIDVHIKSMCGRENQKISLLLEK